MGQLWDRLLTTETLTRGWHLARDDVRQDFSQDLYSTDVYGQDLKRNIQETQNRIRTGTYQARPLFRMEVPKGVLAFRPGTVIPIQDRVVLSAIILLIAPQIDKRLSESVFSWRVKDSLPNKGTIFRESNITDLPFLRKRTIRIRVDPFESWYEQWPEFDQQTRRLFQIEGYRFLATSDIAAYFENIQLPILRDRLLTYVHDESELINLLFTFLETWAERTADGRAHFRGIPQGNFISSFLGNIFLLPLDDSLTKFCENREAVYFRYMDDVRIFTKRLEDARIALLHMARTLRELHLNVQTAKTRIYDENLREISTILIDERVDTLSEMIKGIQRKYRSAEPPPGEKLTLVNKLADIARQDVARGQKITGARHALEGLSLRCFQRWTYAHMLVHSDAFIDRLLREISKSADGKLTRKLISTTKRFPRKRSIQSRVLKMIQNDQIIFPYQEAECLRAIRYLSAVSQETKDHAWDRLNDPENDRYLRMQAAYLISRTTIRNERLDSLLELFNSEADPYVQVAISTILVQRQDDNQEVVRQFILHPNEKVRNIGKFYRTVQNESTVARKSLRHAFKPQIPWILCDCMSVLHLMAESRNSELKTMLLNAVRGPRLTHPIAGLRPSLQRIFTRVRLSMKDS